MKADVVVVGGGPAGASAAIRLARRGVDVCLLDRARFPRAKPCGEFLSPGATPLLEELGVREAVEAAGALRLERVRIDAHGAVVELDFPDDEGAPPWGYSLSRLALDAILVEAARTAGARVHEGTRVDEVRLEPERAVVSARGADGEPLSVEARLVVGAGGRNCPVARAMGVQRRDRRARFDLLAHWSGKPEEPGTAGSPLRGGAVERGNPVCELRVRGDRYVAIAPIEGGRWNVNCVVPRSDLRAETDTLALYRRVTGVREGPTASPDEEIAASDVTAIRTARATADRALLVGDAALFLDPFTGQGLYLALRSAALAAEVIPEAIAHGAERDRLAPYEAGRHAEFAARRCVSRALQAVLFRKRPARAVVRALSRDRGLARTLASATGDLTPSERVWRAGYAAGLLKAACSPGRVGPDRIRT
ncbi:MAG TPA: NAD(P)/FAD-dependent oxidoreductase [Gemmatimonadota bacterium]|nr:NAD(P)/FAD-dependent oxidoreductase [Gemmatimonadota bacterium]